MSASPLVLIEMSQTDGEDLLASFDMDYAGELSDLLNADWRLTLRRVDDPADVLVDVSTYGSALKRISIAPADVAGRVSFFIAARSVFLRGKGGAPDPIVYAGELLMEIYGAAVAQARVELSLAAANTYPGLWL